MITNNEVIRRVRNIFKLNDKKMIQIFKHADYEVEKMDIDAWVRRHEDPLLVKISDRELAMFLNGFIIEKRGKREGSTPEPEEYLTNNMILRKLQIALSLTSDEILDLFKSIDRQIGKHELSAFFRKPDHRSYRPCLDQYLRNFLTALTKKFR